MSRQEHRSSALHTVNYVCSPALIICVLKKRGMKADGQLTKLERLCDYAEHNGLVEEGKVAKFWEDTKDLRRRNKQGKA